MNSVQHAYPAAHSPLPRNVRKTDRAENTVLSARASDTRNPTFNPRFDPFLTLLNGPQEVQPKRACDVWSQQDPVFGHYEILRLTNLAPAIQEALLFLPKTVRGPDRITENRLRTIASLVDWDAQIQLFRSHLAGSQR